jgi:hypothetical protein
MLDVHAPHEKMHDIKDFLLHLFTITIGLLIALSLEGLVEWQHHRHLVQEANADLRSEIEENTQQLGSIRQQIRDEQKQLDQNLAALEMMRAHPGQHQGVSFTFTLKGFDDTAWKTAQTTGAFAYMPYKEAKEYSGIYDSQDEIYKAEQQVNNDAISAASLIKYQKRQLQALPGEDRHHDRSHRHDSASSSLPQLLCGWPRQNLPGVQIRSRLLSFHCL